mmetsp:Transcript_5183/g.18123  ORF Transcript_5183/g.18123 Transcript_5183/m.18123 type:complete len:340 (+) Transcript_5183:105-1124(+)
MGGPQALTKEMESQEAKRGKHWKKVIKELGEVCPESERKPGTGAAGVYKRALELVEECRAAERATMLVKHERENYARERDSLASENKSLEAMKEKLEELCRGLTAHNKKLQQKSVEDEQLRAELSKRFDGQIEDIKRRLDEQGDDREKAVEAHESLKQHYMTLADKADEDRKQLDLMLQKVHTEKAILESYRGKFDEFHEMITKSNAAFATFKTDLARLTKENKSLAKDRKRSESELKELANAHERVSAQKKSLEGLCRSLQSEVRSLREGASSSSGRDAAGDASAVGSSSPAGEAIETAIKEGAAEEQAKAAPSAAEAEVAADTAGAAEAGHDGGTST